MTIHRIYKYSALTDLRIDNVSEQFQLPDTMKMMDRFKTIDWRNNAVELPSGFYLEESLKMKLSSVPETPVGLL